MDTIEMRLLMACREIAEMALETQPEPELAVSVFLELADRSEFRSVLKDFLAHVSSKMRSGDGAKDVLPKGQSTHAPSPEAISGAEGHTHHADEAMSVMPPRPETLSVAEGHILHAENGQRSGAPATELHEIGDAKSAMSQDRIAGASPVKAEVIPPRRKPKPEPKFRPARMPSVARVNFYIFERQGSRTAFENIPIGRIKSLLKWSERQTYVSGMQAAALRLADARIGGQAPNLLIGDAMTSEEIRALLLDARTMTEGPRLVLPPEWREGIDAA